MSSTSLISLELARELFALEAARVKNAKGNGSVKNAARHADQAARVVEGLRIVLTAFAGKAGYRSLLVRALTLAKAQEPSLAGVEVLEDGSLSGLDQVGRDPSAPTRGVKGQGGSEILVAQLLDLLVIFIGEPLMHQLVRSAWPNVPKGAFGSRTKDTV